MPSHRDSSLASATLRLCKFSNFSNLQKNYYYHQALTAGTHVFVEKTSTCRALNDWNSLIYSHFFFSTSKEWYERPRIQTSTCIILYCSSHQLPSHLVWEVLMAFDCKTKCKCVLLEVGFERVDTLSTSKQVLLLLESSSHLHLAGL